MPGLHQEIACAARCAGMLRFGNGRCGSQLRVVREVRMELKMR